MAPNVAIEPWGEGDLPLLQQLLGDPAMMAHLGGPEAPDKVAERQLRYLHPESRMYKIVEPASAAGVGSVGYWEHDWRGERVLETGWMVLPAFQGRGIAGAAMRQLIPLAASERLHRCLHAFPNIDNAPSNALCAKLGFTLAGAVDFEYPKGSLMRCNDWRLELFA